jgi:hypothetical protein
LHPSYETAGGSRALREPSKKAEIGLDIGEGSRIHGQEIQRMLQEFGNGLLFVGNGADHQRGLQLKNVVHGIHVPTVAQFRQMSDRGDVGAPFRYANEEFLRADCAQDGCGTGRQGNDALPVDGFPRLHRTEFSRPEV